MCSDTHGLHDRIDLSCYDFSEYDVFIHAGDSTNVGRIGEISEVNQFLGSIPIKHKLIIAGNHDWGFQTQSLLTEPLITNATYLRDSSVVIDDVKFYGSPWTPEFCGWAFMVSGPEKLAACWEQIPEDTNVLITHGPAYGHLDTIRSGSENLGCKELTSRMEKLPNLKLHVFGHIHGGYGVEYGKVIRVNAATCDERYRPINPFVSITLDEESNVNYN